MELYSKLVLGSKLIPQSVSSVTQSCPTLCNPMDCSMPGLPVHHQLAEFTQTHVHWVGGAIHPSRPLSSPSPPAFNLSQHQGLFQWVSSSHQVAKVLEFQLQHQSFQWIFRTDFLYDGLVGSPCSPRDSQESSPTPHFKSINFSALNFLHSPTKVHLVKAMVFPVVMYGCESWTTTKAEHWSLMLLNCGVEDSWEFLGLQGHPTSLC